MAFIPKAHEIYKHFKGNLYQVVAVAEHSETGEQMVVYQAMYGDFKIYVRPLNMFISKVDKLKYPDVAQEFRFELQGPDADRQKTADETILPTGRIVVAPEEETANTVPVDAPLPKGKIVVAPEEDNSPVIPDAPASDGEYTEEELALDPMVFEFLDADTYEERLNILSALHHRITDEMITTMSIACDIEVGDGSVEDRYDQLRTCLVTLGKFEINRR